MLSCGPPCVNYQPNVSVCFLLTFLCVFKGCNITLLCVFHQFSESDVHCLFVCFCLLVYLLDENLPPVIQQKVEPVIQPKKESSPAPSVIGGTTHILLCFPI